MYINVRTIDGKRNVVITVSKTSSIEELKAKIHDSLEVEEDNQRLFYRGKQLVNGHTLFDYNINLNDVIQLMVRSCVPSIADKVPEKTISEESNGCYVSDADEVSNKHNDENLQCTEIAESEFFKVGNLVDVLDVSNGTWLEGKISSIRKNKDFNSSKSEVNDGLLYTVVLDTVREEVEEVVGNIRPRTRSVISCCDIKVGDHVLANYNIDKPNERGHWYECIVTRLGKISRSSPEIYGRIALGHGSFLENVKLKFTNELMKLEDRRLLSEISENEYKEEILRRKTAPSCLLCRDRPNTKCRDCGCHVCGSKNDPDKQIMCDECDMAYHLQCLNPPLDNIPSEDEWYCPSCKNDENEIIKAGEKLRESKKKAKMASSINSTSRDWGKGMACVGRTKECTLVPPNHYGPIPGIEVGTCWKFRLQASEAGVHRPHVAGIHGRETDGAYSIVLSGGYEDDLDEGETFMYTGSGGRDLSGNKRTAEQSCDQTLTRMNKALALNCNAPLNEKGAKSKDWKKGKPIRVIRNYKGAKHSKYAPDDGNRYDGIYKVVEYYPQKGKSGFIVWRYVLKRDDPSPAPWTKEGKMHIERLGLKMLYPEGYLEAEAAKAAKQEKDASIKVSPTNKGKKRPLKNQQLIKFFDGKKKKISTDFTLEDEILKMIEVDISNEKLWNICKDVVPEGRQKFLSVVSDTFVCICCQEVVYEPVTTKCKHNFCLTCLKRSFKAEVFSCPTCRNDLGEDFKMTVNESLSKCLLKLFPGYNVGR